MEYAGTHRSKGTSCFVHSLLVIAEVMSFLILVRCLAEQERMTNVCTVVDSKTDGDHIVDYRNAVKSDVPEGQQTQQVEVDECDAKKDEHCHGEIGSDDHQDDEYGDEGECNVHDGLLLEDNVYFEVEVSLIEGERIAKAGLFGEPLHVGEHLRSLGGGIFDVDQIDRLSEGGDFRLIIV